MIWRQGEAYTFAPTNPPPQCWLSTLGAIRAFTAGASSAVRSIAGEGSSGARAVTLQVQPGTGTGSYTIEEKVPNGWTVTNLSADGAYDSANGAVRWGLYMDGAARTVTYTLVPTSGVAVGAQLVGEVTVDGEALTVTGDSTIAGEGSTELRLPAIEIAADRSVKLHFTGPAGQVCELESSTDLVNWMFVTELFLPNGSLEYTDSAANQKSQRYYRLKVR